MPLSQDIMSCHATQRMPHTPDTPCHAMHARPRQAMPHHHVMSCHARTPPRRFMSYPITSRSTTPHQNALYSTSLVGIVYVVLHRAHLHHIRYPPRVIKCTLHMSHVSCHATCPTGTLYTIPRVVCACTHCSHMCCISCPAVCLFVIGEASVL